MVQRNTPPELITPQEAAELSDKYGTTDDIYRANDIYRAYLKRKDHESDSRWRFLCAIAAIYAAGRIQGYREARAAQKLRSRKK